MTYDNTNSGILFREREKKNERAPDYTGKINVEGKDMRLAAWLKEGKSGKFLSIRVSDFQNQQTKPQPAAQPAPADNMDDFGDVPF